MGPWLQPEPHDWWGVVEDALQEDVGSGDVTSQILPVDLTLSWYIEAQADAVLCGAGIAAWMLNPSADDPDRCFLEWSAQDGDRVSRGQPILRGRLPARRLLMHERVALNFLMMLSGVATLTNQFVQRVEGTSARIVDTRKTVPNLRALQKYAVRCGGGANHRMGLYDGVMLKDNHIAAAGSIRKAVEAAKKTVSHTLRIEVECERLEQVEEAIAAGADVILLDNMDPFMMRDAVRKFEGKAVFEASGGIDLDTVRGVAMTGVDLISVGALTHSAVSVPFHLEIG